VRNCIYSAHVPNPQTLFATTTAAASGGCVRALVRFPGLNGPFLPAFTRNPALRRGLGAFDFSASFAGQGTTFDLQELDHDKYFI
jgi:hypothetical protein